MTWSDSSAYLPCGCPLVPESPACPVLSWSSSPAHPTLASTCSLPFYGLNPFFSHVLAFKLVEPCQAGPVTFNIIRPTSGLQLIEPEGEGVAGRTRVTG